MEYSKIRLNVTFVDDFDGDLHLFADDLYKVIEHNVAAMAVALGTIGSHLDSLDGSLKEYCLTADIRNLAIEIKNAAYAASAILQSVRTEITRFTDGMMSDSLLDEVAIMEKQLGSCDQSRRSSEWQKRLGDAIFDFADIVYDAKTLENCCRRHLKCNSIIDDLKSIYNQFIEALSDINVNAELVVFTNEEEEEAQ